MERGTEEPSPGAESAQPEAATLSKTSRESDTQDRSQVPSGGSIPTSSDSTLEEMQRQLAINLASIVQNTVEKETKELLRQIRDNSERQITLLKASLPDSWRNASQTDQLRTALNSEEPWLPSDEALVNIKVGGNGQEVHDAEPSYTLEALRGDSDAIGGNDKTAVLIILAVWGFANDILDDPELRADLEVPHTAISRDSSNKQPGPLNSFFEDLASKLSVSIPGGPPYIQTYLPRHMELKLNRGGSFIRMIPGPNGHSRPNKEFARLIMQEWIRTSSVEVSNTWGMDLSRMQGNEGYESFDIILAPLNLMTETFMTLADMARVISRSALAAPGGFDPTFVSMAVQFLLSFTGPWKLRFGPFSRFAPLRYAKRSKYSCYLKEAAWKLPGRLSNSNFEDKLNLAVISMHHTIRLFSPMDENHGNLHVTDEGGIQIQRHNHNNGVRKCMWYGGIAIYQKALVDVLDGWHKDWEKLLIMLDDVMTVQIEDIYDTKKRASLMFETSTGSKFERSDRYFFVTELLRISAEWIKETGNDLQHLQAVTTRELLKGIAHAKHNYNGEHPNTISWEACADVISHNWTIVFQAYEKYEKDLLGKIERKAQEVKSLRDGLFSATSVREATKSTSINEYILVFTVMTLYGIDMFNFDIPGQTTSFAITTVLVSLATYLAAWGIMYGVRQRRKKGGLGELLSGLRGWIGISADTAKRALRVRNGPKQAAGWSRRPEIEVRIDQELPAEPPKEDAREGKKREANFRKKYLSWNVIPTWPIRRRQHQEAGV
ncbi:hypothetical protein PG991_000166 [Apiospora marii]|uniref:Uncharacterized protein n=1 Tax=Apiospora marii TaxID=335849 RepID=A0ABR1T1D2_9PEZI